MIRVFLDTNILISATFWEGDSYKILNDIAKNKIHGFTTSQVLDEYRKILKRDFGHDESMADSRVKKLLEVLEVIVTLEIIDVVKDDPDDNKILEGALAANAEFIISYDRHLLVLKNFRGIPIVKPEIFLKNRI